MARKLEFSTVIGDTWEEFVDNIETQTKFGVDLDYQLKPSKKIELIDVYGNLWTATVKFLHSGGYVLFTDEITRNKRCHH